jgi:hypothetical protein
MEKKRIPFNSQVDLALTIFIATLITINWIGFRNLPLFHFIAELNTIIVSCCLFAMTWILREKIDNGYFTILGIGLLFTSFLDLVHMTSYEDLFLLPNFGVTNSIYAWLGARFLQSLTFLTATFYVSKRANHNLAILIYSFLICSILALVFFNKLPPFFDPHQGISLFGLCSGVAIFIFSFLH